MTDVFFALSDPTRREIVRLLRAGERSAGDLAQAFPLAKSTLSAHFSVLKRAGLVSAERRRTSIVYRLNVSRVQAVVTTLLGWLDGRGERPPAPPAARRATAPRPLLRRPHADTDAAPAAAEGPTRAQVLRGGVGLVLLAGGAAGAAWAPQRTTRRVGRWLLPPVVA